VIVTLGNDGLNIQIINRIGCETQYSGDGDKSISASSLGMCLAIDIISTLMARAIGASDWSIESKII